MGRKSNKNQQLFNDGCGFYDENTQPFDTMGGDGVCYCYSSFFSSSFVCNYEFVKRHCTLAKWQIFQYINLFVINNPNKTTARGTRFYNSVKAKKKQKRERKSNTVEMKWSNQNRTRSHDMSIRQHIKHLLKEQTIISFDWIESNWIGFSCECVSLLLIFTSVNSIDRCF